MLFVLATASPVFPEWSKAAERLRLWRAASITSLKRG